MAHKDEYEVARLYTKWRVHGETLVSNNSKATSASSSTSRHLCSLRKMDKVIWSKRNMVHGSGMPSNSWQNSRACVAPSSISLVTPKNVKRTRLDHGLSRHRFLSLLSKLNADNHDQIIAIASLPEKIRGFGHVKKRRCRAYYVEKAALMSAPIQEKVCLIFFLSLLCRQESSDFPCTHNAAGFLPSQE